MFFKCTPFGVEKENPKRKADVDGFAWGFCWGNRGFPDLTVQTPLSGFSRGHDSARCQRRTESGAGNDAAVACFALEAKDEDPFWGALVF